MSFWKPFNPLTNKCPKKCGLYLCTIAPNQYTRDIKILYYDDIARTFTNLERESIFHEYDVYTRPDGDDRVRKQVYIPHDENADLTRSVLYYKELGKPKMTGVVPLESAGFTINDEDNDE